MEKVKIGCCCLVINKNWEGLLGLDCKKGRGIILPGGKFEPELDKSYRHTAIRELEEETGLKTIREPELVFHGMCPDGYYDYCYLWEPNSYYGDLKNTEEGSPIWVSKLDSKIFHPYYQILFESFLQSNRYYYKLKWLSCQYLNYELYMK